jgi:hypothetical protein
MLNFQFLTSNFRCLIVDLEFKPLSFGQAFQITELNGEGVYREDIKRCPNKIVQRLKSKLFTSSSF